MRVLSLLCLLLLSSCLGNNSLGSNSIGHINIYKLRQIHVGMTQEEVYQIMRYPSTEDQIVLEEGCYDIWFYVTRGTILGQSEYVRRNLTPVVFKDGIYIGMGYDYYNWVLERCEEEAAAADHPDLVPAKKENENIELEKSLTAPPSTKPATAPNKKTPSLQQNPNAKTPSKQSPNEKLPPSTQESPKPAPQQNRQPSNVNKNPNEKLPPSTQESPKPAPQQYKQPSTAADRLGLIPVEISKDSQQTAPKNNKPGEPSDPLPPVPPPKQPNMNPPGENKKEQAPQPQQPLGIPNPSSPQNKRKAVSMCSRPKAIQPVPSQEEDTESEKKESHKTPLDDEDDEMLDNEREENFNLGQFNE